MCRTAAARARATATWGGGGLRVAVEVAERLGTEVRPHILLRKVLLPPLEGDWDVAEAEGGDYGRKALTG